MVTDREERIRQLAHEIWEREGHPHGRDAEHWRLATEAYEAYEAYEAERASSRRDDAGEVIPGAFGTSSEWTMRTPPVASPAVATPSGAAANQPVTLLPATRRKRRTKAEMEAARATEATAPPARRGRKPQGESAPQVVDTALVPKRKRRTKAEMAAAAAGVAGAAAAVAAATVAVTKRRRGAKAETVDEAAPAPAADAALRRSRKSRKAATLSETEPDPVTVASGSAAGAVPDPGAAGPSDPALKASPRSAPDADPSGERVAD